MNELRITVRKDLVGYFLAGAACVALMAFLFLKRSPEQAKEGSASMVRSRMMSGAVVRIDPPYLYVESDVLGRTREFAVVANELTYFLRLVPWQEGERERALAEYTKYVDSLHPKTGDPIPPPPPAMKPSPFFASELKPGDRIGVVSDEYIQADTPIIAKALRPLTDEELKTGRLPGTFPF